MMYVGNLESYQGIDLLLESFALACKKTERLDLVVIGGDAVRHSKVPEKSPCSQYRPQGPFFRAETGRVSRGVSVAGRYFGVSAH